MSWGTVFLRVVYWGAGCSEAALGGALLFPATDVVESDSFGFWMRVLGRGTICKGVIWGGGLWEAIVWEEGSWRNTSAGIGEVRSCGYLKLQVWFWGVAGGVCGSYRIAGGLLVPVELLVEEGIIWEISTDASTGVETSVGGMYIVGWRGFKFSNTGLQEHEDGDILKML
jgi:hypothetical protein